MKALAMIATTLTLAATPALAGPPGNATEIDNFSHAPAQRWDFFSDQVMGGASSGKVEFADSALRLTGKVSTANNGGFIQARLKLTERMPDTARALVLRVRGNGDSYYVHLRTGGTLLPWQYYQARFATSGAWQVVRLPFSAFKASGRMMRSTPKPGSVRSVAVVAFGHDHSADVSVDWIGWE